MASLDALTAHLRTNHDPAACVAYRRDEREDAALDAYLAATNLPHTPLPRGGVCKSLLVGSVTACNCVRRYRVAEARAAYRATTQAPPKRGR